jgi:hypothetical protein
LPGLAIQSPEKRCGKTTLLDILRATVKSGLPTCNITPAAFFRVVEKYRPCLLIDEADTFLANNDEIRGFLNSGHTRGNAFTLRCVGDDHEPKHFSTWAPRAIALIGQLHDTLVDRSIIIDMRRKLPSEKVEQVPMTLLDDCKPLRQKLLRWVKDTELNEDIPVTLPKTGNDRQTGNWTPLYRIAKKAGGHWPDSVNKTLLEALENSEPEEHLSIQLLRDIKTVFESHWSDRLFSSDLVTALLSIEDGPWQDSNYGKGLSQNLLGRMLRRFKIRPRTIRTGSVTKKGYEKKQFEKAVERYLNTGETFFSASDPPKQPSHRHNVEPVRVCGGSTTVTNSKNVTVVNPLKPAETLACDGVTDEKGVNGEKKEKKPKNEGKKPKNEEKLGSSTGGMGRSTKNEKLVTADLFYTETSPK